MNFSIQTGTVENFTNSIQEGWYAVTFQTPYADGVTPLVFTQIQTRNGEDTPGLRLRNISNAGFEVRMDELIMNNTSSSTQGDLGKISGPGKHPNAETLAWLAVS
ncbi:MAG: hypothetical protein AAGG75_03080 [Bacteroidota bacterium]